MILWIDAQLSPAIASWLTQTFDVTAIPLRDLGLRDAADRENFWRLDEKERLSSPRMWISSDCLKISALPLK